MNIRNLTDEKKARIRELKGQGGHTYKTIALEVGCGEKTVQRVLNPRYDQSCREAKLRWRDKDPIRAALFNSEYRSKRDGIPFNITRETCPPLSNTCPKCGVEYKAGTGGLAPTSRTLDKIVPTLGYVTGNVMWLCCHCNAQKQDMTLDDFRWWVSFLESHLNQSVDTTDFQEVA